MCFFKKLIFWITEKRIKQNKQSENNSKDQITFATFDKLQLKPFAENLLKTMEDGASSFIHDINKVEGFTMSLNALFGNGKTTFLKMFEHFIKTEKKEDYSVLFINAWKSDFYKEPVITILSELVSFIKVEQSQDTEIKNLISRITKAIGEIGNQVIRNKAGFDLKEIVQSSKNGKLGEDILKNFEHRKKVIKSIKEIISKYTEISRKKLLIIVDELDRSRPDYAVHFLEDMKHFFDIKNTLFLVAVNREQMEATVKCLYGQELNFDGYYRKFFTLEKDLPDPYKEAQQFIDNLITKSKVEIVKEAAEEHKFKHVYFLCKMFKLTLREVEIFIRFFEMILGHSQKTSTLVYFDAYSFFICLFLKDKNTFKKIINEEFTVPDFIEFIKDKKFDFILDENHPINRNNSTLLLRVACSFIRETKEEHYKYLIEKQFNAPRKNIDQILRLHGGGFHYKGEQVAIEICKNIKDFKPHFD